MSLLSRWESIVREKNCVSVGSPYFPAFGINTDQKNSDTFHEVKEPTRNPNNLTRTSPQMTHFHNCKEILPVKINAV